MSVRAEDGEARAGEPWWSLQPLGAADPPAADGMPEDWTASPIDRFVYAKLLEQGLEPAPLADRRSLIRRVTYDLTGLPPLPGAVEAFVNDPRRDAYERLVDRLLASPRYGERWGRHWLDIVRFGESHGYEQNHLRDDAWPFRDYVIRSLNQGKPFDRLVREHLAADQIAAGDPDVEVATGFLVAGPHDTVGIGNIEGELQKRNDDLDDMLATTAATFLGLTVHCARCHDHKFDPISQEDYYRLQAVFAGVQHRSRELGSPEEKAERQARQRAIEEDIARIEAAIAALEQSVTPRVERQRDAILAKLRPPVEPRGTEEAFPPVEARFVRMTIDETSSGAAMLDELEVWRAGPRAVNVALASRGAKATARSSRTAAADASVYSPAHLIDGDFARHWISGESRRGEVTIKLPRVETVCRIFWSRDREGGYRGPLQGNFPTRYTVAVSLDGADWTKVVDSYDRTPRTEAGIERLLRERLMSRAEKERLSLLEREIAEKRAVLPAKPTAYAGTFVEPEAPTRLLVRGNPMQKGQPVPPGSLSALQPVLEAFELPLDAPEAERRLALASWIVNDDNPLTARVLANRLWHYHFGRGLVGTPNDFGFNGEPPTHPKLLDWLARRIRLRGWRLKPFHREILLSRTYRQSSAYHARNASRDREAKYLWRFRPRRLSAEEIRDSILAASGALRNEMGGPGFRLYRYTVDNVATYYPLETFGRETFRRSVYHQAARSVKGELLGEYDCPDSALPAPKREVSTSPLQALSLLNNRFVLDQTQFLADRLEREVGDDSAAVETIVRRAYALLFGREPDRREIDAAAKLIETHGLFIFCRALFNTN